MILSSLGLLLLSVVGIVTGQQTSNNTTTGSTSTTLNPVATQYSSSFKNAGGKILSGITNVYVIFYGDWSGNATTDETIFLGFVDGLSSTSWFSILKEYTDGNGGSVSGPLNLAAAVHDSGSLGLDLKDHNAHKTIILNAVNSGYLSENNQLDSNGVYVVLLGPDVKDAEFCNANCGYNSYSDQFQYIFIGYPGHCPNLRCMPPMNNQRSPNNSPSIDSVITIFSHEIQDIMTDPRMDAWYLRDSNNQVIEVGDFCSGSNTTTSQWYGNLQTTESGASYNLEFGNAKYLVQTIYSKEKNACLLSK